MRAPGCAVVILALLIFVALTIAELVGVSIIGYRVGA